MKTLIKAFYGKWIAFVTGAQSVFLLVIRLYWGIGFALAGWGKFSNWERPLGYFTNLGIPFPEISLALAAGTELVGGICLAIGLGARVVTVPLAFTMGVAYATAHQVELLGIFEKPEAFLAASPFLYLFVTLVVMLFGAGKISVDALICQKCGK